MATYYTPLHPLLQTSSPAISGHFESSNSEIIPLLEKMYSRWHVLLWKGLATASGCLRYRNLCLVLHQQTLQRRRTTWNANAWQIICVRIYEILNWTYKKQTFNSIQCKKPYLSLENAKIKTHNAWTKYVGHQESRYTNAITFFNM
jgi:hypothetical protein